MDITPIHWISLTSKYGTKLTNVCLMESPCLLTNLSIPLKKTSNKTFTGKSMTSLPSGLRCGRRHMDLDSTFPAYTYEILL